MGQRERSAHQASIKTPVIAFLLSSFQGNVHLLNSIDDMRPIAFIMLIANLYITSSFKRCK